MKRDVAEQRAEQAVTYGAEARFGKHNEERGAELERRARRTGRSRERDRPEAGDKSRADHDAALRELGRSGQVINPAAVGGQRREAELKSVGGRARCESDSGTGGGGDRGATAAIKIVNRVVGTTGRPRGRRRCRCSTKCSGRAAGGERRGVAPGAARSRAVGPRARAAAGADGAGDARGRAARVRAGAGRGRWGTSTPAERAAFGWGGRFPLAAGTVLD